MKLQKKCCRSTRSSALTTFPGTRGFFSLPSRRSVWRTTLLASQITEAHAASPFSCRSETRTRDARARTMTTMRQRQDSQMAVRRFKQTEGEGGRGNHMLLPSRVTYAIRLDTCSCIDVPPMSSCWAEREAKPSAAKRGTSGDPPASVCRLLRSQDVDILACGEQRRETRDDCGRISYGATSQREAATLHARGICSADG